jgi:hypothetical protein
MPESGVGMTIEKNPYEPSGNQLVIPDSVTPEKIWRIRFTVSMWVCGIVGIQCLPVYPMIPGYWARRILLDAFCLVGLILL